MLLSSSSYLLYINVLLLVLIHSSIQTKYLDDAITNVTKKLTELEVLLSESKKKIPSAYRHNTQVVVKICYTRLQTNLNPIKLYEAMKSFQEEIRKDYAVFPEKVFEKIVKFSEELKELSDKSQSNAKNISCVKPENINPEDVTNLENSIKNYQSALVDFNIFNSQKSYLNALKENLENLAKNHGEE
ncbi:hypothetical protein KSF78_0008466 [Schistosoma japonicum]|nr:hypothetical protein KSF78_0008466 [Schistosoma japonicum]